jgi:hypothetical protein
MREIAKIPVGIRRYIRSEMLKINPRLKSMVRSASEAPPIMASGASVVITTEEWLGCEDLLCAATIPGSGIGPF